MCSEVNGRILDEEETEQSSRAKHKAIPLSLMNLFPPKREHIFPFYAIGR